MVRDQFKVDFKCPHCGQVGVRDWEEPVSKSRAAGQGRTLSRAPKGFHIEEGRTESGEPLLVCDNCDEFQPLGLTEN